MEYIIYATAFITVSFLVNLFFSYFSNQKLNYIMATIAQLNEKVDQLQEQIDATQAKGLAAVATLQSTIEALQKKLDERAFTPEDLDEAMAKLEAAKNDLAATFPEEPATPPTEE